MHRTRILGTAVAALAISALCAAQQAGTQDMQQEEITPLTIGDKAPDIDIAHWLKPGVLDDEGQFEPVTTFENDKVYVLEFWATWCGPCVASMPHLSELQEKYAEYDVTFIGVSDEPLPTVVSFLFNEYKGDNKIQNDRIGYTLTTDPDRSVYTDYFKAAGQRGIPCAFIIGKDNHVEWIGHPMTMDEPLEQIVHDSWDRDAFKADWEQEQAVEREMTKMRGEYMTALRSQEYDKALDMLNDMLKKYPGNPTLQWQKFTLLLVQMDEAEQAYAIGEEIAKDNWDNAAMLNQIAWMVADDSSIQTRDLDFAQRLAERANDLTESKDPAILDTLARVYWEQGDHKKAINWQRKAVEHAGDDMMGEQIRETLKKYESES